MMELSSRAMVVMMCCGVIASVLLCGVSGADKVNLTVRGMTYTGLIDDNFVCATLDWWPETKCDFGQCPWGKAGILKLDLNNKILSNAIKAFNPLRIRIGGSLQDQVVYQVGKLKRKPCPSFELEKGGLFGFSHGCLPMDRWDELSNFFNQTGAKISFGLNALIGKKKASDDDTLWVGYWSKKNAHNFMKYNVKNGHQINSYELGNELSGTGVAARLPADQYAKDITKLNKLIQKIYHDRDPDARPKVLGPAGFYDKEWFSTFLSNTKPDVVNGVTHHIYNLGAGGDKQLIHRVQDPFYLAQAAQIDKDIMDTVRQFAPWSGAWVGEAGGAYRSGGKDVSNTFVNGFWYLDQMGMASTLNHKVYCRQSLIGGNYGLLNTTSFIPNPDYYGALLWHRLMGTRVLEVTHSGSPYLRAYSHCSKNTDGATVLLINMSNSTTFEVLVGDNLNLYPNQSYGGVARREEYHLTPKDGNIQSDVVLLNGTPLQLTESSDIPSLEPKVVDGTLPVSAKPDSIVFVTLKGYKAPACHS